MFKINKENVKLVTKPSDINNNLSLLGVEELANAETLAVIHRGYINLIPLKEKFARARYVPLRNGKYRGQGTIKQVKWVVLHSELYMIVLSDTGLQIYSSETCELKYSNSCQEDGDGQGYTQGVCCVNLHTLCVGSSMGNIWVFRASESMDIELVNRHYAHDGAILNLVGSENYLISSGMDKRTIVWTVQHGEITKFRDITIYEMDSICTSIAFSNYTIICGHSSGEVTVSDILEESINIRDVAHKLAISAVDFTPIKYYVLTASRDCYIKIWEIVEDSFLRILFSFCTEIGPIVGAQFFNANGTEFGCVSTQSNDVLCFITDESPNKENKSPTSAYSEKNNNKFNLSGLSELDDQLIEEDENNESNSYLHMKHD